MGEFFLTEDVVKALGYKIEDIRKCTQDERITEIQFTSGEWVRFFFEGDFFVFHSRNIKTQRVRDVLNGKVLSDF